MRHFDWQLRYEAFIQAKRGVPFAWGSHDCVLFAAACVEVLTGVDRVPPELRGYTTAVEAYRILSGLGGVEGVATTALGDAVSHKLATTGDIVLASAEGRPMLAVCNGQTALAPGPDGLVSVPFKSICWRVR